MPTEIIFGGARLDSVTEQALNELLARHCTFADGPPLFRIGWAMDDNKDKLIPICFHECQASYHLLSWEAPSPALIVHEKALGEDLSKGSWACLLHFVDPQGNPVNPTSTILEGMIPVLNEFREADLAARLGYKATRDHLRKKRMDGEIARDAAKKKVSYDRSVALLENSNPAFDGNAFSAAGPKARQSNEIVLTDLQ